MILGFKQKFENGQPTRFIEKILSNEEQFVQLEGYPMHRPTLKPKLHTIRAGNRWKVGHQIHFATGVRTKNYKCWAKGIARSVQNIQIDTVIGKQENRTTYSMIVKVDGFYLESEDIERMSDNDGFDSPIQFIEWFHQAGEEVNDEKSMFLKDVRRFKGQLIHWTNMMYPDVPRGKKHDYAVVDEVIN